MIQINLLENASKGSAAKLASGGMAASGSAGGRGGAVLIMISVVLMLGVNGGLGWMAWSKVNETRQESKRIEAERDDIQAQIDSKLNEAEQVRIYREVVSNQMDVLRSLDPPDRILWCEKLNMLANLMPSSVFLTEVDIEEKVTMVETEQSKQARAKWEADKTKNRGKQPEVVKRPLIRYVMRITGLALGPTSVDQFDNAMKVHQAMIDYKTVNARGQAIRFMDAFNPNIEFESMESTVHEGRPVNKFVFKLTTRPIGGQPDPLGQTKNSNVVALAE